MSKSKVKQFMEINKRTFINNINSYLDEDTRLYRLLPEIFYYMDNQIDKGVDVIELSEFQFNRYTNWLRFHWNYEQMYRSVPIKKKNS